MKPDHLEAWLNLLNALAQTGDRDDAIPHFERAIAIQPGYDAARRGDPPKRSHHRRPPSTFSTTSRGRGPRVR